MFSFQEQISAATKNNLESQLALITALTGKPLKTFEKGHEPKMTTPNAKTALRRGRFSNGT